MKGFTGHLGGGEEGGGVVCGPECVCSLGGLESPWYILGLLGKCVWTWELVFECHVSVGWLFVPLRVGKRAAAARAEGSKARGTLTKCVWVCVPTCPWGGGGSGQAGSSIPQVCVCPQT